MRSVSHFWFSAVAPFTNLLSDSCNSARNVSSFLSVRATPTIANSSGSSPAVFRL